MEKEALIIIGIIVVCTIVTLVDLSGMLKSYRKGLWYSLLTSYITMMFAILFSDNAIKAIFTIISGISMVTSVICYILLIKNKRRKINE